MYVTVRFARVTLALLFVAATLGIAKPGLAAGRCMYGPYRNHEFTVVIAMSPGPGKTWAFEDAPSLVARQFLSDLNDNALGNTYVEANGVAPFLTIRTVLSESNAGTRQDSATATITGNTFSLDEVSGDQPFTSWRAAVKSLANRINTEWVKDGWHQNSACPSGSQGVDAAGTPAGGNASVVLHVCDASGTPRSFAIGYWNYVSEARPYTASGWYDVPANGCRDVPLRTRQIPKTGDGGYAILVSEKAHPYMDWTLPKSPFVGCGKDGNFETSMAKFGHGYGDCESGFSKVTYTRVGGDMISAAGDSRATLTIPR